MSGLNLNLGIGSQVSATGQVGSFPAVTAGQAGFGPSFTSTPVTSKASALAPTDAFGIALWVGIGSLALLLFIRYSLPN